MKIIWGDREVENKKWSERVSCKRVTSESVRIKPWRQSSLEQKERKIYLHWDDQFMSFDALINIRFTEISSFHNLYNVYTEKPAGSGWSLQTLQADETASLDVEGNDRVLVWDTQGVQARLVTYWISHWTDWTLWGGEKETSGRWRCETGRRRLREAEGRIIKSSKCSSVYLMKYSVK